MIDADLISISDPKMENCAVPIVITTDDHTFELDEKALSSIVCRDDIKDREVVIISVAGAFRKGKSFLLNFFLRFLRAKVGILFVSKSLIY